MFSSVTGNYDLLNRILTWGFDGSWRRTTTTECSDSGWLIDLCCGTGELALTMAEELSGQVVGIDFSVPMILSASEKRIRRMGGERVNLVLGDASNLPFKNASTGCVGVSFSLRNLVYRNPAAQECLKEVCRVLRPGGRFVTVETSQPKYRSVRALFRLYVRRFVPLLGGLISGNRGAYRYLGISAANFPPPEEISRMIKRAGFSRVFFRTMTLGVVAVHMAVK